MNKKTTACPLDCYDACEIELYEGKILGVKSGHTKGFLCPHLHHFEKHKQITQPRYKGEIISMEQALRKLVEILDASEPEQTLFYRGSGNFGLMQEVSDHFFASFGATLTDGNLCDGAGAAGIIEGRGSNKNMPLSEIEKSEVVILWGRNPHTTNTHLLPLLKDKTLIVIDPRKIESARNADLHIQIKPHGDLYLALLLCRFLHIENEYDEEYLQENAPEYEDLYELTQTVRIKATLEDIDVTLGQIGALLELVKDKKTAIICGVGIQKYSDGADIMRAIDAFAVMLGLFGKEGCGVAYLGDSKEGIASPFMTEAKRVSKVNTDFSLFSNVFIQGANPLAQMPDTQRVINSMKSVANVIYFGLYENETSQRADLIIPAKNFFAKEDIRTSYAHNAMLFMPQLLQSEQGVSEYELSHFLCEHFGIKIQSEESYLNHFKNFAVQKIDGSWQVESREEIPYQNGFDTDDGEFCFLEEYDNDFDMQKKMFLLTPKSPKSLNSQFYREKYVYLHKEAGFLEDQEVQISSENAKIVLKVKIDATIRKDCVLLYSGTPGVNMLTSSKHSFDGKNAIYQENKVEVKAV
jgi:anaerobic selenocysteine-containing dehydrogenase